MGEIASRIPLFVAHIKAHDGYLACNRKMLDIHRGGLLPYLEESLKRQLSAQSFAQAVHRIPPINVLQRIINKLSKIYSQAPARQTDTGPELLAWYAKAMGANQSLGRANAYFNLFKGAVIEPYLDVRAMKPRLRAVPYDRFLPYAYDKTSESPDAVLTYIETIRKVVHNGRGRKNTERDVWVWKAVDAEAFVYFDEDGEDLTPRYAPKNPEGLNPYKRLPYVYVNRDAESLVPMQDTDMFPMTILLPLLLTDINFAHMFQAFAILYGINVTDDGLKYSPNAFWSFKTEPGSDQKPEIGVIKPTADIDAGLSLVANQFAFWLNSKGIKPGEIGEVSASNFQSGIAKMLDEMDTAEDRNEQIPYFADGEAELWSFVLENADPVWRQLGLQPEGAPIGNKKAVVTTTFPEQVPMVRRGAVIDEVAKEMKEGLTTRRRALKRLNPQMTDAELTQLEAEIDAEKESKKPAEPPKGEEKPEKKEPEEEDDPPIPGGEKDKGAA